jgi:hypothetical protein
MDANNPETTAANGCVPGYFVAAAACQQMLEKVSARTLATTLLTWNVCFSYTWDEQSGYYFHQQSGYYFDPHTCMYFDTASQTWCATV